MNLLQTFGFLNSITESKEDYQEDYRKYILDHKERVKQFADWMKENLPEIFEESGLEDFDELTQEHDDSKFSEEEFEPYAQKWFGDGRESLEYEEAWKHHYLNNPHHPEYWLGEDMPKIYILEMLCDWGSFSIEKKDFNELFSFYYTKARDDEEKNLSDKTKLTIEEILEKIKIVLSAGGE